MIKIISIFLAGVMVLESTVYGMDLPTRKHLRVPLTGTARISETFEDRNNSTQVRINALEKLCRLLEEKEVREKGQKSKVKMREFLFSVLDNAGDEEIEVLVRAIKLLRIFLIGRLYEQEVIEKYKEVYSRLKSKELRKEIIRSFALVREDYSGGEDFLLKIVNDGADYKCCRDLASDIVRILRKKMIEKETIRAVLEVTLGHIEQARLVLGMDEVRLQKKLDEYNLNVPELSFKGLKDRLEKDICTYFITRALVQTGSNMTQTAKLLGIESLSTLYVLTEKYEIEYLGPREDIPPLPEPIKLEEIVDSAVKRFEEELTTYIVSRIENARGNFFQKILGIGSSVFQIKFKKYFSEARKKAEFVISLKEEEKKAGELGGKLAKKKREKELIELVLEETGWNETRTATILGINHRQELWNKMSTLGIYNKPHNPVFRPQGFPIEKVIKYGKRDTNIYYLMALIEERNREKPWKKIKDIETYLRENNIWHTDTKGLIKHIAAIKEQYVKGPTLSEGEIKEYYSRAKGIYNQGIWYLLHKKFEEAGKHFQLALEGFDTIVKQRLEDYKLLVYKKYANRLLVNTIQILKELTQTENNEDFYFSPQQALYIISTIVPQGTRFRYRGKSISRRKLINILKQGEIEVVTIKEVDNKFEWDILYHQPALEVFQQRVIGASI